MPLTLRLILVPYVQPACQYEPWIGTHSRRATHTTGRVVASDLLFCLL